MWTAVARSRFHTTNDDKGDDFAKNKSMQMAELKLNKTKVKKLNMPIPR